MPEKDKLKKLYDNISSEYDLPDYDKFSSGMMDDKKSKQLHEKLVSDNWDVPEYETFKSSLGLKKKKKKEPYVSKFNEEDFTSLFQESDFIQPSTRDVSQDQQFVKEPRKQMPIQSYDKTMESISGENKPPSFVKKVDGAGDFKETIPLSKEESGLLEIERKYAQRGGMSPLRKIQEFSIKLNERSDQYLLDVDNLGSIPDVNNSYVRDIKKLATDYGINYNEETGDMSLPDGELKTYKEDVSRYFERAARTQPEGSFGKDMLNGLANTVSNTYASGLSMLGMAGLNAIPGYSNLAEGQRFNAEKYQEQVQGDYDKIVEKLQSGQTGEAFAAASYQASMQIPMLITMAMGSSAGSTDAALALIGADQAIQRYDDLEDVDIPTWSKVINSIAWGMSDPLLEKFGTAKTMASVKNAMKRGVSRDIAEKTIKDTYATQLHKYAASLTEGTHSFMRGGFEEVGANSLQNMLDGKDPLDGAGDVFIVGAFTDAVVSSPKLSIDTKEAANELVKSLYKKIPKDLEIDKKAKAMELLIEKEERKSELENIDPALSSTKSDPSETIDAALKTTAQPQTVKENINQLNKEINNELETEYPDFKKLIALESELSGIEDRVDSNLDRELTKEIEDVKKERGDLYSGEKSKLEIQQNAEKEKQLNTKLKDLLSQKQKQRNEVYSRALTNIDSPLNSEMNKLEKAEAKESTKNIIEQSKKEEITNEKEVQKQQDEEVVQEKAKSEKQEVLEDTKKSELPKENVSGVSETKSPEKKEASASNKIELDTKPTSKAMQRILKTGPDSKTSDIKRGEDNVGQITVDKDWRVKRVDVDKDFQRQNIASDTYRKLNDQAKEEGKILKSDVPGKINNASEGVWKKLVDSGEAQKLDDGSYQFIPLESKQNQETQTYIKQDVKADVGDVGAESSIPNQEKLEAKAKNEIESKLGKIDELETKKQEIAKRMVDRASRLGNVSFALDEAGKKQAIEDIYGLVKDAAELGMVSIEMGAVKAINYAMEFFKDNAKAQEFIDKNKDELRSRIESELEDIEDSNEKKSRIGQRVEESDIIDKSVKQRILNAGIKYIPQSGIIQQAEADKIIDEYEKTEGLDSLYGKIKANDTGLKDNTITRISVSLYNKYMAKADQANTKIEAEAYKEKAAELLYKDMVAGIDQGRAVESKKAWKEVLGNNPDMVANVYKKSVSKQQQANFDAYEMNETVEYLTELATDPKKLKELIDKKAQERFNELVNKGKKSSNKIQSGKAKIANGMAKLAGNVGAVKYAVAENDIVKNKEIVQEILDGILDVGVGSLEKAKQLLKEYLFTYFKPSDVDGIWDDLVGETNAESRLLPPKKKGRYDEQATFLSRNVPKLVGMNRNQLKAFFRDYLDVIATDGSIDSDSVKDLIATALGLPSMDKKIIKEITQLSSTIKLAHDSENTLRDIHKKFINEESSDKKKQIKESLDEYIQEYKRLLAEAKKSNKRLSEIFADELGYSDYATLAIQGNLLTPVSLTTNIVANTLWVPVRGAKNIVATILDWAGTGTQNMIGDAIVKASKKGTWIHDKGIDLQEAQRDFYAIGTQAEYLKGFYKGFIEGAGEMVTGQTSDDLYLRDVKRAMKPLDSLIQAGKIAKNKFVINGEKVSFDTFMKKTVEATFGVTPEIMFRLLNLGDKPYRRAAERARLAEIAKKRKLKGDERELFMNLPDEEAANEAFQAGVEATFQQDNFLARKINKLYGSFDKALNKPQSNKLRKFANRVVNRTFKILFRATVPYVKTPTNLLFETIDYSLPPISIGRALLQGGLTSRQRKDLMAKGVIGLGINAATASLFAAGIISRGLSGLEEDEDRSRVEPMQYAEEPPLYINYQALRRWMSGGSSEWQDGDVPVSAKRYGILSTVIMAKDFGYKGKSNAEIDEMNELVKAFGIDKGALGVIRGVYDQSFMAGVNSVFTALQSGGGWEMEKVFTNLVNSMSSIIKPNTLSSIQKYRDGIIREKYERTGNLIENSKNVILNTFKESIYADNGLPAKINIWGEEVERFDDLSLAKAVFGVHNPKKYKQDFGTELYNLYRATMDESVLPSQPDKDIMYSYMGESYNVKLTNDLVEGMRKLIGSERKALIKPFVDDWDENMSIEEKMLMTTYFYKNVIDPASLSARKMFINDNREKIEKLLFEQHKKELSEK